MQTLVEPDEYNSIAEPDGTARLVMPTDLIVPSFFCSTPEGLLTGELASEMVLRGMFRQDEIEILDVPEEPECFSPGTKQPDTIVEELQVNIEDEMLQESAPNADEGIGSSQRDCDAVGHPENWPKPPPILF
jgi:hypothetical protein